MSQVETGAESGNEYSMFQKYAKTKFSFIKKSRKIYN